MTGADLLHIAFAQCVRGFTGGERRAFERHGVTGEQLARPDPLLPVVGDFYDKGGFAFADELRDDRDTLLAFAVVVRDESGEPCDIAVWHPQTNRVAAWRGTAWALGQGEFPHPLSVLRADRAVTVFASPMQWLAADRRGLVVVDWQRARRPLLDGGGPYVAEDFALARRVRSVLTPPTPRVLTSSSILKVAA